MKKKLWALEQIRRRNWDGNLWWSGNWRIRLICSLFRSSSASGLYTKFVIIELDQHSGWEIRDTRLFSSLLRTLSSPHLHSHKASASGRLSRNRPLFSVTTNCLVSCRLQIGWLWELSERSFPCAPLEPCKWASCFYSPPESQPTAPLPPMASCSFQRTDLKCWCFSSRTKKKNQPQRTPSLWTDLDSDWGFWVQLKNITAIQKPNLAMLFGHCCFLSTINHVYRSV